MKNIDREIREVEERLQRREAAIKQTAREGKERAVRALKSPLTLAAAMALGFVVAGGIGRGRGAKRKAPVIEEDTKEQTKGFAAGTLLMSALTWLLRSQFGGPVGAAHWVLSKIRAREAPGSGRARLRPPAYH